MADFGFGGYIRPGIGNDGGAVWLDGTVLTGYMKSLKPSSQSWVSRTHEALDLGQTRRYSEVMLHSLL